MVKNTWTGLAVLQPLLVVAADAHAQPWATHDADAAGSGAAVSAVSWRPRGEALLSLGGYMRTSIAGKRELGALLLVVLPFDRVAVRDQHRAFAQTDIPTGEKEKEPPGERASPATRQSRPPPKAGWMPALARRCVSAAWRAQGLASSARLDAMRSRARASALLPEARFRYARGWDQSYRLSPTNDDPYRLQETNGGSRWLEGRLTWRLHRVLFADEEIPIERLREQRVQQRAKLAAEVLQALFAWYRARWTASDPALTDDERLEQLLAEQEAAARLDVLTDGWFSAWLDGETGSIRTPPRRAP